MFACRWNSSLEVITLHILMASFHLIQLPVLLFEQYEVILLLTFVVWQIYFQNMDAEYLGHRGWKACDGPTLPVSCECLCMNPGG